MSDIKLGNLITAPANRDAIHIAVAPVTASETVKPGQHLALMDGSTDRVRSTVGKAIGIADPFLASPVPPGQPFWLCLYPQTITSLRHEWTHPAFGESSNKSRDWITAFAARWEYSFDDFMAGARQYVLNGSEFDSNWENQESEVTEEEWSEFWEHFRTLTGLSIKDKDKEFVTCCPQP